MLGIIKTNWINIAGVFVTMFIYGVCWGIYSGGYSLFPAILSALLLVCLYGMMPWLLFVVLLLSADILLLRNIQRNLKRKLIIEWIIVSAPFFWWIAEYNEWVFLVAITTFLITQLARQKLIIKLTPRI